MVVVVQFGSVAQYLLVPKVKAEPLSAGKIEATDHGSMMGTFFAKVRGSSGS